METFVNWIIDNVIIPTVCIIIVGGIILLSILIVSTCYESYQHRNDPPPTQLSLKINDWVCTATHRETYGKGQSREVCDQYTRITRR